MCVWRNSHAVVMQSASLKKGKAKIGTMTPNYHFYTTKEIKPLGWSRRQLEIQAEGLSGNLDRVWPDVRDSMWIGGDREGWERVPYWLDGFIPLAYLLDDEDKKRRAATYIDSILSRQEADGWICPNGKEERSHYDNWAVILISKVLTVYYQCSGDERIPGVVYRVLRNYYELLKSGEIRLFDWAAYRWYETFIALNFLREKFPGEAWMEELAHILREQGVDYRTLRDKWKRPLNKWDRDTHIVNLAMMLKSEAVSHAVLGEEYSGIGEDLYEELHRYNGLPTGMMTGDECLSGRSPIQGVELCAVVEMMYSMEYLYACTGNPLWAERLERVAFNALPAALTDDAWAHQYVQLSNQTDCRPFPRTGKPIFRTNSGEAHVFGLEPHFGCCTANFGQGWPKLVLSSFLRDDDGVIGAVPVPSELTTEFDGVRVRIRQEGEYPFVNSLCYRVCADSATGMKLKVRIPSFARNLTVNGKPHRACRMLEFGGFAAGETVIRICYDTVPHFVAGSIPGLRTVACGSLLFSVPIKSQCQLSEYVRCDVERKFPYCDYRLEGISEWNFGFADRVLSVESRAQKPESVPFDSKDPPLVVRAKLCHIDWEPEEGYEYLCAKHPTGCQALDEPFEAELYPYGCAKLRMTELPAVRRKREK